MYIYIISYVPLAANDEKYAIKKIRENEENKSQITDSYINLITMQK